MIPQNFLLISFRYLFTKEKKSTIRYMSRICFLGIFLATFSLSFITSIMKGFETATYTTMQNIYPDIIMDAGEDSFDMEALLPNLQEKKYFTAAYSPHRIAQGLIHNNEYEMSPLVIQLQGIDPKRETETTHLSQTILNKQTIQESIQNNQLLLGKKAMQNLHILPGESITFLFSEETDALSMKFQEAELVVGGVFETGIDEYDSALAYCSSHLFKSLFPDKGISQVYIKLSDTKKENSVKKRMRDKLQINAYSWKDLYPTLISAMQLESIGMLIILLLIICIATINIMSVLFMYIHQKQKNIALFSCMGMSRKKISLLFLSISLSITFFAATTGIICSNITGVILQTFPIIKLPPNVYYSDKLPFEHNFIIDLTILVTTISISYLASLIPLKKISRMNVALIIKNE